MKTDTIITWAPQWDITAFPNPAIDERMARIQELKLAGAVVSEPTVVALNQWRTTWVDSAAANAWIDFIKGLALKYALPLESAVTADASSEAPPVIVV
jgi:hypothetical protein